ncbi:MAG: hypothetical protein HYX32_11745 [Actinobacteria bacterium]|nr:hypothetical protein [Actinomycetota bacterium]
MPATEDTARQQAEADRRNRERDRLIEYRTRMERDIGTLRDAAEALRSLAAQVGDPLEQAIRGDGPGTWRGRKADDFRAVVNQIRDDLTGAKMSSVRYSLESAALDCELRANAMQADVPLIPAIAVPRFTS